MPWHIAFAKTKIALSWGLLQLLTNKIKTFYLFTEHSDVELKPVASCSAHALVCVLFLSLLWLLCFHIVLAPLFWCYLANSL